VVLARAVPAPEARQHIVDAVETMLVRALSLDELSTG